MDTPDFNKMQQHACKLVFANGLAARKQIVCEERTGNTRTLAACI
jgi:hypothetical protein